MKYTIFLLLGLLSITKSNSQVTVDNELLKIPVVFRIVHNEKLEGSIPNHFFNQVIEELNVAFNNPDIDNINYQYRNLIGKGNIEFYQPKENEDCEPIKTITWHKTQFKSFNSRLFGQYKLKLFRVSPWKFKSTKILNIFICNMDDKWGYATREENSQNWQDSVVIDINYFLAADRELSIYSLVHEIGHYFGLDHIWGSKNADDKSCQDSDSINDTPNQTSASYDKNGDGILALTEIARVCGNPTQSANYENFMDYSLKGGMFTEGQVLKMRTYIKTKRAGLLWKPNCKEFSESVLSQTKQREKFGTRMIVNNLYPYGTITDRAMVELFNSIGIIPTKEKLEQLGLKIIANNKFEDLATGEFVDQHQIYERLDLEKTKAIANKTKPKDELKQTFIFTNFVNIINPNYYSRKVILINNSNNKEIIIDVGKAGINIGDKKSIWTEVPLGKYTCRVYTTSTKKEINSFNITVDDKTQTISLQKNGYN